MAMSDNAILVFDYLKAHDGEDFTMQDISDATGVPVKSVNGILVMTFQRHKEGDVVVPLIERVPAEVELEDGTHKEVKLIRLTDAGRKFVPAE